MSCELIILIIESKLFQSCIIVPGIYQHFKLWKSYNALIDY